MWAALASLRWCWLRHWLRSRQLRATDSAAGPTLGHFAGAPAMAFAAATATGAATAIGVAGAAMATTADGVGAGEAWGTDGSLPDCRCTTRRCGGMAVRTIT